MTMRRWEPFSEALSLRDAMSQLFEQSVWQPSTGGDGGRSMGGFSPALDVSEDNDEYCVRVSLPGVKPEDVEIQIQQGTLTISGELKDEQDHQDEHQHQGKYHMRERRQGRFFRSVSFPTPLQADKAQATFENGVLQLEVPKAEESKPRRIQVQGGQRSQQQIPTTAKSQGNGGTSQQEMPSGARRS